MPSIPPLGQIGESDHGTSVQFLSSLCRESIDDKESYLSLADDSLTIYTYGTLTWPTDKIVINEIQNAVIAATDVQTREPPRAALEPVETDGQGEIWPMDPAMLSYDPMTGQPMPMDPAMVQMLQQPRPATDPMGQMQIDPMTATPIMQPGMPSAAFVEVNDKLVSEVYQSTFDRLWQKCQLDRWIRSNILRTNVEGWSFPLFEWDDDPDSKQVILRSLSPRQVGIDPTVEDIDDAAYAYVDLVLDADEAVAKYPHLADVIRERAQEGYPNRPLHAPDLGAANERKFERPVVVMRTVWLRNQMVPLSMDEALSSGKIIEGMVEDVSAVAPTADTNAPEEPGMDIVPGDIADTGPVAPVAPLLRPAMLLADTGAEVAEGSPGWPEKRAIRQITMIDELVVDDRQCEHVDIPLLHNVCIPIPGKPWGLGEPFRLLKLQEARSRIIDAMVNHAEFYRSPSATMPQSMYEALKKEYGSAFISPSTVLIAPDDLFMQFGGKACEIHAPPPTPPALIDMQQILKSEMSDQSGHTDAMRGVLPSAQSSGKAVELLQQSATALIGFKSKRTGDLVHRLARLMLHCIVTRLEATDMMRVVSKYPLHVMEQIHRRAKQIEWDVDVTVISGTGQIQMAKKLEAKEDFTMGLISKQTCRERLNLDHQQEEQRMTDEAQKMLAAQPVQPAEGEDKPPPA